MKIFKMAGLFACLALLVLVAEKAINARGIGTTTNPETCFGDSNNSAEVCVDSTGDWVPTTDNDASLGISSLRWADLQALDATFGDDVTVSDDLTVTGDAFKTMVATVTVLSQDTISIAGACGGILRLTATTDVTSGIVNTFTAPAAANAGCIITVINSGGNGQIGLDDNALFDTGVGYPSAGEIKLGTSDSIMIGSLGTRWFTIGTVSDN